jgi:selenocysteine lyase/cysteine desulfurase
MAIPTDLSKIQDRIFYITGSYKYAQGGEGCCFMTVPKAFDRNPTFTGWFAGFQDLENNSDAITFAKDGYRFAGSTMDYTALYRLHAVLKLYSENGITIEKSHACIQNLQKNFLAYIDEAKHPYINRQNLITADLNNHGHFLSFKMPSVEICKQVKHELMQKNVITDSRGDVLRFGFGLYQDLINSSIFFKT